MATVRWRITAPVLAQWIVRISLILGILVVYSQVRHFDFLAYDDPLYVWLNDQVKAGITLDDVRWALTANVAGNWTPLAILSHMLDCQLFGLTSGMHHLVNVLFHSLSTLLLFSVLRRATARIWPSAFVAFMFALHPLHVASVAWISERKDVLSAFFFFAALYAYLWYVESPGWRRYLAVAGLFSCGLMSKPMLVTFPFTLLLFDIWPLRRIRAPRQLWEKKLLWEKLPLLALSAAVSAVTYQAQGAAGAFRVMPLSLRIENALVSYVTYIGQMLWPRGLAIYYPHPTSFPGWELGPALAILLAISALAWYTRRACPYFMTGWCWYLGMLVPTIGLVQVGGQARADRYTYLPMVGLLWIVAWGVADVLEKLPRLKPAVAVAAIGCCVACMACTWTQLGYWQNGVMLFEHATDVTEPNDWTRFNLATAHNFLGAQIAADRSRYIEAAEHFETAIQLDPDLASAHYNLGTLYSSIPGREDDSRAHLRAAARLQAGSMNTAHHLHAGVHDGCQSRKPGSDTICTP
jgi:tetratricopeptide (TPR) repeat protein